MKKYLFGMLAIALAVGFSSFTSAKKTKSTRLNSSVFVFTGDLDNPSQVADKAKWLDQEEVAPECSTGDDFACTIEVEDTYYSKPGEFKVLNTSGSVITIVAEESPTLSGIYRVDDASTNILTILNGEQ